MFCSVIVAINVITNGVFATNSDAFLILFAEITLNLALSVSSFFDHEIEALLVKLISVLVKALPKVVGNASSANLLVLDVVTKFKLKPFVVILASVV